MQHLLPIAQSPTLWSNDYGYYPYQDYANNPIHVINLHQQIHQCAHCNSQATIAPQKGRMKRPDGVPGIHIHVIKKFTQL